MAEDQESPELSGPAPGSEIPYEERFLSQEKQYPTKEERARVLEEIRRPKSELPHVPPFVETAPLQPAPAASSKEEAWAERVLSKNRAERLTQAPQKTDTVSTMAEGEKPTETQTPPLGPYNPSEHIEAQGGAAPLKRILEAQKPVEQTFVPGSSRFKVPLEAERTPISQRPLEKMPPVQQVPISVRPPMPEEALRTQYTKTQPEQPKQSFFGSLWNRIRGRA
jgi:hypothetical protein